jgi:hypothetical protein
VSDALKSIGGFFGKAAPTIAGGTAISGLIGNIISSITRGRQVSNLESAEKKFANLTPEQLAGLVSRAEAPLSQDLLQTVGNTVQADMASRGLAQAPGIFAAAETQDLAPYRIQEQQKALELVLKQMGLPIEYARAIIEATGGNADVSKVLAMLMNMNKGGGGVPDTSGIPSDTGSILEQIIASQIPGGIPGSTPPTLPGTDLPGGTSGDWGGV